jgi:hypothetical protein
VVLASEGAHVTDPTSLRACVEQCYDAIESVCARLHGAQWQKQSLCPDWTARDVVSHLGMMERVMTGWLPASAEDVAPVDRIGPYEQEVAELDAKAFAPASSNATTPSSPCARGCMARSGRSSRCARTGPLATSCRTWA